MDETGIGIGLDGMSGERSTRAVMIDRCNFIHENFSDVLVWMTRRRSDYVLLAFPRRWVSFCSITAQAMFRASQTPSGRSVILSNGSHHQPILMMRP